MKDTTSLSAKNLTDSLAPAKIKWFRRQLSIWGKQNFRNFPWRQTCDPYAILVAEFLLQRTEAATVVPIYKNFLCGECPPRKRCDYAILYYVDSKKYTTFSFRKKFPLKKRSLLNSTAN